MLFAWIVVWQKSWKNLPTPDRGVQYQALWK